MMRIKNRGGIGASEYCSTSLSAQSWQYRDRGNPKSGLEVLKVLKGDGEKSVSSRRHNNDVTMLGRRQRR